MGVYDLRLTNDAFWGLTLRQFVLLGERHRDQEKRADRRAGGIIAALYNIHTRTSETDPVKDWQDYFTEWKEESADQTEEQMFETMLLLTKSTEGLEPST